MSREHQLLQQVLIGFIIVGVIILVISTVVVTRIRKAEMSGTPHLWIRLLAWITDWTIASLTMPVILTLLAVIDVFHHLPAVLWIVGFCAHFFVFGVIAAQGGRSPGKRLAGILVEKANGTPLSNIQAAMRAVIVLCFSIGVMVPVVLLLDLLGHAFGTPRRLLHEHLTGTRVRQTALPSYALIWIPLLMMGLAVGLVMGVMRPFVVATYIIPADSMAPTIREGDRAFVNKLAYRFGEIHRGDIVVFFPPSTAPYFGNNVEHLKRVVGLPGETVIVTGDVLIDGEPLHEPYLLDPTTARWPRGSGSYTIPAGSFFVLGDNRNAALDSRGWYPPAIPLTSIHGRMTAIFWPPAHVRAL